MFESKKSKKIEHLEKENKKLINRITTLENKIDKRPSDYEKEAIQASKKAAEYRNKAKIRYEQSEKILENITTVQSEINEKLETIKSIKEEISKNKQQSQSTTSEIIENSNELIEKITTIQNVLENHPELSEEVNELETLLNKVEEDASKGNTIYKGIVSKKTEIDELYREIIGYTDEDENGEQVEIEGLKGKLENTYNQLNIKSKELDSKLDELNEKSDEKVNLFIENNKERIDETINSSKLEYETINDRIKSLLPDALTAGLSSAFIKKKDEEVTLYEEYKRKFGKGIRNLTIVAILPVTISIYSLLNGVGLSVVIERAPKILLAFLPIYIPLIWITISANKKVNLSKRLIEEYSHKQVLSMTIEGLSNQINEIEDNAVSEELRIKLLNNFLFVSSENPGKLISDYQKSDNPFLNFLERDNKKIFNKRKSIVKRTEDKVMDVAEKMVDSVTDVVTDKLNDM